METGAHKHIKHKNSSRSTASKSRMALLVFPITSPLFIHIRHFYRRRTDLFFSLFDFFLRDTPEKCLKKWTRKSFRGEKAAFYHENEWSRVRNNNVFFPPSFQFLLPFPTRQISLEKTRIKFDFQPEGIFDNVTFYNLRKPILDG